MFKNLLSFETQRTALQALGFYIAYLIVTMLMGGIISGATGIATNNGSFEFGARIGAVLAIIICLTLSITVVAKKKQLKSFVYLLCIILSGGLALFLGGIGGLIPTAYLTTIPSQHENA